ncbi:MAG: glycosyltransferase [Cyanobacteriota bacterium]|nr:glycosyltransferase [Cyanobacteriota bacterium]
MPHPSPLVSVLMLAHNHGAFLQQAIASVQAQSLQAWELLIGEDSSSDNTASIAHQAAAVDCRVRVLSNSGGAIGFHLNFARLLAGSQAPYVAFLEGDDWWSEPSKLERQVELLEKDLSLSFCGGRTRVVDQRPVPGPHATSIGPSPNCDRLALADLITAYSFHFSSVLMRRESVELPGWIYRQYCLDRPLYLLAAQHGDAGVIDAELSVYRLHGGGAWAPLTPLEKAHRSRQLFTELKRQFPDQRTRLSRTLSRVLWSYLPEVLEAKQHLPASSILMMAVHSAPAMRLLAQLPLTLAVIRRLLPSLP